MKRITVIGTGFAALSAARKLRQLDRQVEITVVGPRPELVFLPSLIWIPSGQRKAEDLRVPLQEFFRKSDIRFHAGEAYNVIPAEARIGGTVRAFRPEVEDAIEASETESSTFSLSMRMLPIWAPKVELRTPR